MQQVLNRMRSVTVGFKNLFVETLEVRKLRKELPTRSLTRKEHELLRTNSEAIRKVTVFFVLQLPPVIGLLPIAVALTYPKHILTHHFWNEEQQNQFLWEDRQRQVQLANESLRDILPLLHIHQPRLPAASSGSSSAADVNTIAVLKASEHDWSKLHTWTTHFHHHHIIPQALSASSPLYSERIQRLSNAQNICGSRVLEVTMPSSVLYRWLQSRARQVVEDDQRLLQEGISQLTARELQHAVFRRGFSPFDTSASTPMVRDTRAMQQDLQFWLDEQLNHQDRQRLMNDASFSDTLYPLSLAYLQAYNAANQVLVASKL